MKRKNIIIAIIFIVCILYLWSKSSTAAFQSILTGSVEGNIADWSIKIDNKDVSTNIEKTIGITDITWNSTHTRNGKVSPGSIGTMKIKIDPSGTDVSLNFSLEIIDKTIDSEKILEVTRLTSPDITLTQNNNIYSATLTKAQINNEISPTITLEIEWTNDDNVNDLEKNLDNLNNFIEIKFIAEQLGA